MNRALSDTPDTLSASVSAYNAELTAACHNLQAEKSDLEHLIGIIRDKQIPPQQVSWLLKEIWQRLKTLRKSQAGLSELINDDPESTPWVEQAFSHIQSGENFSLNEANAIFEQIYKHCHATGVSPGRNTPELTAAVRAIQALIAAIKLDHRDAANLYAQAAGTRGLDVSLQRKYQLQLGRVLEDLGRDFMDDAALLDAIGLYENELLDLAPKEERPDDWAATQHHLGNALSALGQRQRGTRLLERAIVAFENALSVHGRERDPLNWAAAHHSLGNALGILAQRHADTDMLEQAVEAFESALEVRTQEQTPQDWAVTQNSYATALLSLGQSKKDSKMLKHASEAYKNVLKVWTREQGPLQWAATMNNLGTALRVLGEHRKGPRTLEQSVAAYRSALSERTRERVPYDWAMTQNNLGAALHKLGSREELPQYLHAAIEAYQQSLNELTRERGLLTWAMTMANLAAARKALAELTCDVDHVHAALSDFQTVGSVFREASHAQYYELVTEQIALLRKLEKRISHATEA
jgi:tetratricopeptide (TPR) repeat protein